MDIKTASDHFIAHTGTMPGHYGKGATEEEAVKNLRGIAGPSFVRNTGYALYRCHPATHCGGHGEFVWYPDEGGYEPVQLRIVPPVKPRDRTRDRPRVNGWRTKNR